MPLSQGNMIAKEQEYPTKEKREKYWKELMPDEKIERMRTLVKSLTRMLDRTRSELYELRTFMWEHSHEENGETVIRIKKEQRYRIEDHESGLKGLDRDSASTDEVYF